MGHPAKSGAGGVVGPGSPHVLFGDDKCPDGSGVPPGSPPCVCLGLTALVPEWPQGMRVWVLACAEWLPGDADLSEDW